MTDYVSLLMADVSKVGNFALADCYEESGDPRAFAARRLGMRFARIPNRNFYVGVYTVTQDEYTQVMGENPSWFSPAGSGKAKVKGMDTNRFPVETVSWHDAVDFCRRLSEIDGENLYRLPTEVEWDHACRAGTTTEFHYGDGLSSTQTNFDGNYPYGGASKGPYLARTCEVGSYQPNAWGLYDMHGNVWEWTTSSEGSDRVFRGGSWGILGRHCRSAFRFGYGPADRSDDLGFRAALVPSSKQTEPECSGA